MNQWIEVDELRLRDNFRALQRSAGPATEVLAVVKANAYGHGVERCAPVLLRAGAQWLGVTSASEGARVRACTTHAGDGQPPSILVMCGFLPQDVPVIREAGLTPVVWTREQVASLACLPGQPVHVEVDTGMGRQGVRPGAELDGLLEELTAAGLVTEGVFTHFCSAEEANSALTRAQRLRFEQAVAQVRHAGLRPSWVHAGNSSALDNPARPEAWLEELAQSAGARAMVRTGLALYGYTLPIEGEGVAAVRGALLPVMTWKARVLAVRSLEPGETVGYNATFTAHTPMQVALLPVGYADGLRRELSNPGTGAGGWMMLHGQRAPVLGRISMNLTVVDVTRIAAVSPGDEAIVLGAGVTAEDHARLAGTLPYEILCGIHPCG